MLNKQKYIKWEGWISIIFNNILFVAKYWVGISSGSIALIADAWHTLTDSISSVIVLIAGKVSSKPADEKHPFGHGRAEHIAAIIIAIMLFVVAFDFCMSGIEKLNTQEHVVFGKMAFIVTILSILIKELMAQYALWAYRKTKASILKADAWHHRTDSISSLIILVGIFLGKYFWWIDGVLAILVAIMIAKVGYDILVEEIRSLLGEPVDDELKKAIVETMQKEFLYDIHIHHMLIHRYGSHWEMSCHIKLNQDMRLNDVHALCTKVEIILKEQFNIIATVHPEPLLETLA
ncbi:MAG: cation diffusion facilitator family transporter [Mangrovibacterium sp.]